MLAENVRVGLDEDCEDDKLILCSYRLNIDRKERCRQDQVGPVGDKIGSPRSPVDQDERGVSLTHDAHELAKLRAASPRTGAGQVRAAFTLCKNFEFELF